MKYMRTRFIIPIILIIGIATITFGQDLDGERLETQNIQNIGSGAPETVEETRQYIENVILDPRASAVGAHPIIFSDFIVPASDNSADVTIEAQGIELNSESLFFSGSQLGEDWLRRGNVLGLTNQTYVGDVNGSPGYASAHQTCQSEYGQNAYVCSQEELAVSYLEGNPTGSTETGRIIGGPPGFTAFANDCQGFTTADLENEQGQRQYGKTWDFGADAGFLTTCDIPRKFVCCGGQN